MQTPPRLRRRLRLRQQLLPSRSALRASWKHGKQCCVPLSGCAATMGSGDAGCASYAEARLARPAAETVAEVPHAWANWIADLDDRMTGTCR